MNTRLQPGLHPNADILSAFAENALPAHERAQTLAHLSGCAPCREIVFLAQQAAPQPAAAAAPFWQRWRNAAPLFGLGIGAAALASAGLLFMTLRPHPAAMRTESARVQPPAPAPAVSPQPATPKPTPPPSSLNGTGIAEPAPTSALNGTGQQVSSPSSALNGTGQQVSPPSSALKGTGFSPYVTAGNKDNGALAPEGTAKPMPQPIIAGRAFVGSGSAGGMGAGVAAPRASAVNLGNAAPPPAAPPVSESVEVQSAGHALGTETPRGNTALADEARVSGTLAAEMKSRQRSTQSSLQQTSQIDALAAPALRAPLPSNLATTVTVSSGARTLAADTAGALFLSLDAGHHWQPVARQWNGRIAQLRLAPARTPPATLTLDGNAADDSKPAAAAAPKLPASPPEFQLITAAGAVWLSADGLHWQSR